MMEAADFRHLNAFQCVYEEKSYTNAGHALHTIRKAIRRMIDHLEEAFECQLFKDEELGKLSPSPFAERLFNDLRFLTATQRCFSEHIRNVRQNGRVLQVGSSSAVFRTRAFRYLFRKLQLMRQIKISYTSVEPDDAGRFLVSGYCDLYIGCWSGNTKRYISEEVAETTFALYVPTDRAADYSDGHLPENGYIVSLDGVEIDPAKLPRLCKGWESLPEEKWLLWLDRPDQCPDDVVIFAPEASINLSHWAAVGPVGFSNIRQTLRATFLRQHPYEFLPALTQKIRLNLNN
ncbi:LysR family transcriptional regulator [Luteolibacter pohnpeiensis]|uniref:LysR family transcriptional regulator n=2 Tax=Luteolibacter pohnpeiensis TaxID=454153 RepID=A0A934VV02_9BACT|nr:LysR family transcriptional regulator [Luteolibacter pohnpeiensis]